MNISMLAGGSDGVAEHVAYTHTRIYIYMYIYIHIFMHIGTFANTHTYTHACHDVFMRAA